MSAACLKLLYHQQRHKKLALTLPFLTGALRSPIGAHFESEEEVSGALLALLTHLRDDTPHSEFVRIHTCADLNQPVASVSKTYYHPSYAEWCVPKPPRITIDHPYSPAQASDLSAAVQLLKPIVAVPIVEGRFSYSKKTKTYRPFDESDRQFITDALTYDEENEL
jgi:hypothetical protein